MYHLPNYKYSKQVANCYWMYDKAKHKISYYQVCCTIPSNILIFTKMIRIAKKWPNPFSEGENNLHLRSWNQIKRVAEISQPALSGATLKKKLVGLLHT